VNGGVPAHRLTTAHLQAAYPFVAEGGLGGRGVYIGRDLFGGAFTYDAFELYDQGVLTSPNMLVAGRIGRGKSAFIKSFSGDSRCSAAGRSSWTQRGNMGAWRALVVSSQSGSSPGAGFA